MALSYALHHALLQARPAEDRGIRRARFQVLREAPCPASLVEVGFLTHVKEGSELAKEPVREEIARSIALGIENYLRGVKQAAALKETAPNKDES
jgi:N-acetylmuramoyl-L-alanine amidase